MSAELQEKHIVETELAKQKRAGQILSKLEQREQEIAEQLDSRLARFNTQPQQTNSRAQQLLSLDASQSLDKMKRFGPPEPGGVSLGSSPRSKRLNPLVRK